MQRVGPYTLLSRIGVGGMAEIFLARREAPGGVAKIVALKRILPHLASEEDFVHMFLDEAQLAARLSHPHIAQILDFGHVDDNYFIAMEYVPGEDLLALIRRARELGVPTPPGVGATIMAAACAALHHAHEQVDELGRPLGIVHRDVTPSNLIVSHEGVLKLVDFGIAKAERRLTKTEAGALKGKYAYMSPEYALGTPIDRRSDVFSLGIVGFELLTQRRLFHRETELAVLRAITEEPIPSASSRRADLPPQLDAMLRRALARDPGERFQTAQDLQLELEDFLATSGHPGGAPAVQAFMRRLFGADAAQKRQRWALGDLDEGEATEGLGRAPSAAPSEQTLAMRPSQRAGSPPPDAELSAQAQAQADAPVAAPVEPEPSTDHVEVPDLRGTSSRAGVWLAVLFLLAVAGGGAYLALRPTRTAPAAEPAPALPPLAPSGSSALDAPRFDTRGGRTIAQPVARPDKVPEDAPGAWLTLDAPAGVRVVIDGAEQGVAPLPRRKLAAGLHTIALDGKSFALELKAGDDRVEVVTIDGAGQLSHQARTP